MYVDEQRSLFLMSLIEDIIIQGVGQSILDSVITDEEGYEALQLARLHLDIPGLFRRYLTLREEDKDMTDLTQVILFKAKDQLIPREIVETACTDFGKSIGAAAIVLEADGEGNETSRKFTIVRAVADISTDAAMNNLQAMQDKSVVMVLNKTAKKEEDVQPFTIVNGDDGPKIIGFLQGDVSVIPELVKKIQKISKGADTDEEFDKDIADNEDKIKEILKNNSCFIMFALHGNLVFFDKDDNMDNEAEWGSHIGAPIVNNGGTPTEVTAADEPKVTGNSGFTSFSAPSNGNKNAVAASADDKRTAVQRPHGAEIARIKKSEISKLPPELRARTKETKEGGFIVEFKGNWEPHVQCPQYVDEGGGVKRPMHKDEMSRWYEKALGWIPENWKTDMKKPNPIIPVSFLKIGVSDINVKELLNTAAVVDNSNRDNKDTTVHYAGPVPDTSTIKSFVGDLPKIFGANAEQITNPAELYKEENKRKTIADMTKREPKAFRMPHVARHFVVTHHPLIATNLWGDEIRYGIEKDNRIADLEANVLKLENELAEAKKPAAKASGFGSFSK